MAAITLACYTIRIRHKRSNDFELLGAFDDVHSFAGEFDRLLSDLETEHAHDEVSQALQRVRDVRLEGDVRSAIIDAGDYGFGSDIVDVDSRAVRYQKGPGEAELLPFYMMACLPSDKDVGILLLQRHGIRGVFTVFANELRRWFSREYPAYVVEIGRLVPAEVMKHLLQGRLKSLTVTTYTPPKDVTDRVSHLGNLRELGECTITYSAKKGRYLSKPGWLKNVLGGKSQLVEVPAAIAASGDRISVAVEYEGRSRRVDFARPDSLAPYIDCTRNVTVGDDGHPDRDSMHAYAGTLLAELRSQMG